MKRILVLLCILIFLFGCVRSEKESEGADIVGHVQLPVQPVIQQPKKVESQVPPVFEPAQEVVVIKNETATENKMVVEHKNVTVLSVNVTSSTVPLSQVPKVSANHVPVEVGCTGPAGNDVYVRETVVRRYDDGSMVNFTDQCKGTDYLYYYQCSIAEKARSVSCKYVAGKGAVCREGACVK